MNRQFQNFSSPNDQGVNRQLLVTRPTNLSQQEYSKNQSGEQPKAPRQVYNPNPFVGNDQMSQMSQQPDMTSNATDKKEMGVLFYSNNCEHSKTFLVNLMKTKLNDYVKKVCVDGNTMRLPSVVKSVPTLIARGINRPLVGEQVFAWLENEAGKSKVEEDIKCFAFGCNDNYTFIDGIDDKSTIGGNIAEWDKDYSINAPMDTDGDKMKKTLDDKRINKYREERNSLYANNKPLEKNTKVDPEEFNKMFLKQQSNGKNGTETFKQNVRNI